MTGVRRGAVVLAYVIVFCLALPAGLWRLAAALDRRFGWPASPWPPGALVLALGCGFMAWAAVALWRRGGGLPVSALPPPRLVRDGPYAFVRHPIYLGFNAAMLGAGLAAGSRALSFVVAPLLLPAWLSYAAIEERFLSRRFGSSYRRYRRQVGMLPPIAPLPLLRPLAGPLLAVRYEGRARIPRQGGCVLVGNHCCLLDPMYLLGLTRRRIRFLVTAEAHRGGPMRWLAHALHTVPLRRYRPDPAAYREMVRLLADGEVVAISPEGERSPYGAYAGARGDVAGVLARLGAPVIPVGLSGNYDCGPRWAGVLRRRPVTVRVGAPVRWDRPPAEAVDAAVRALLETDPQPLTLDGLPRNRLERVFWRCPACGDEGGWRAADLACGRCGEGYRPTADGRLEDRSGRRWTFGELGHRLMAFMEAPPLRATADGWHEPSIFAPLARLRPLGRGELLASRDGLRFRDWALPIDRIRSLSTERDDTLQVADGAEMWQFRLSSGSPFRFHRALEGWRRPPPVRAARRSAATAPRSRREAPAAASRA